MTFESGGQGLWSTLDDYLAFARLFIGGGAVDGVRLLRSETLAMMASNQLTPHQRATARMLGRPLFAEGHGYGLGVWGAIAGFHERASAVAVGREGQPPASGA